MWNKTNNKQIEVTQLEKTLALIILLIYSTNLSTEASKRSKTSSRNNSNKKSTICLHRYKGKWKSGLLINLGLLTKQELLS